MSKKMSGLGKGLEALIPRTVLSGGRTITQIPLSDIRPNPYQPRHRFDEKSLAGLAQSIAKFGVQQPVLVRRKMNYYELIVGERRFRASEKAGLTSIPAIIKEVTDKESLTLALIENVERNDLNAIEEALGYKRLIEEFSVTHEQVAKIFNKSRSAVTNLLRLLNLPESIQTEVLDGSISEGHARSLLVLESEDEMLALCQKIKDEQLNVRQVEKRVSKSHAEESEQLSLFGDLEEGFSKSYQAKFKFSGNRSSGKIVITYNSSDQLEAICQTLKAPSVCMV